MSSILSAISFSVTSVLLVLSCTQQSPHSILLKEPISVSDTHVSIQDSNTVSKSPIMGYRFSIKGDFDGDGNTEALTEHFFDGNTHAETNKFYNGLTYEELVERTIAKAPYSFATCSNAQIDTLHFAQQDQLLGLSYLKNEGDLNGDGTDEVSYVVNWADWSNLNTCHIATYKGGTWQSLYSFPIRDWQLPDLPETENHYGLLGLEEKHIVPESSSGTDQLDSFAGLIKAIAPNVIEVIYMNEEAMTDTIRVQLKPLPHLKK